MGSRYQGDGEHAAAAVFVISSHNDGSHEAVFVLIAKLLKEIGSCLDLWLFA